MNKFDAMFKEMAEAGMSESEFLAQFKKAQIAVEDEYAKEAWLEEVDDAEEDLVEAMIGYLETIFDFDLESEETVALEEKVHDCTEMMIKLKETNDKLEKKNLSNKDAEDVILDFVRMLEKM